MGKLLALASYCCVFLAAYQTVAGQENELKSEEVEELKDFYVKKLYSRLLESRTSTSRMLYVGRRKDSVKTESSPPSVTVPSPEVMVLHNQLQNKLGWGGDDVEDNSKNRFGPPGGFPQSNQQFGNQQYGPPPNQQYGPPSGPPPNQQYGPPSGPPPNQQYGPPPNQQYGPPSGPPPNQQYGPPSGPPPNQQYGPPSGPPPNQQYGPPSGPPPNQQYRPPSGPPPGPSPNQQYGPPPVPPPNQQYGPSPGPPPNQQYGPPPNQQYGPPPSNQNGPAPNQQYGPPPNQQYGPPPSNQNGPPLNQQYGPPTQQNQLRINQGNFGGHIENFKLSDAVKDNGNVGYQAPSSSPDNQYGPPPINNDLSGTNGLVSNDGSAKIYKHVYIHTPPPERESVPQPRVIRPNTKQDTHYQIIFVKAPAPPKAPQTEIELPPPPERKTLVYVLVKRPEKQAEIKFRAPDPTQPTKPEVYFIRYKGNKRNQNGGDSQPNIDFQSSSGDQPLLLDNNDLENDGYSNAFNLQAQIIQGGNTDSGISNLVSNAITKGRDSVSYPNTEYRATPNMLGPNQEPMSIAVYDKVRNSATPSPNPRSRADTALITAASSNVIRRQSKSRGSHYTAPGSKPFIRASGKMVKGHYVGMSSNVLRNHYHSPSIDEDGYIPI